MVLSTCAKNLTIGKPCSVSKLQKLVVKSEQVTILHTNYDKNFFLKNEYEGTFIDTSRLKKTIGGKSIKFCENGSVWVSAGLDILKVEKLLKKRNLSIPIFGLKKGQTIGAACNSGSHGGSLRYGCITSYVIAYKIVDHEGKLRKIENENIRASGISLGLFGIVVAVKMQCRKSEILTGEISHTSFEKFLEKFSNLNLNNRFMDVTWFPNSGVCRIVTTNEAKRNDKFSGKHFQPKLLRYDSDALDCLVRFYSDIACDFSEKTNDVVQYAIQNMTEKEPKTYTSYDFNVLRINQELIGEKCNFELAFNYENSIEVLEKINKIFSEINLSGVVINIRATKADNIWSSPCYKRDTLWIGFVTSLHSEKDANIYNKIILNLRQFSPRVRWGKLEYVDSSIKDCVGDSFRKWRKFWELKKRVDPSNKFRHFSVPK